MIVTRTETRDHRITNFGRLFRRADYKHGSAGSVRLLGASVYTYHDEAPGWAHHRAWNCGFVALHHVSEGKSCNSRSGWSLTFAQLRLKRIYRGVELSWRWADTFRTRP